jgi:hypothetical protein
VWLQHSGAPVTFTLIVCKILNEHYLACWIVVVHQHLPCHYPGHHIVHTLAHLTIHCGALSKDKQLHTSIPKVMSCSELWNRHSPPLCNTCFGSCHTVHGGASSCVSNMMVYIHTYFMCSDYHQMVCRSMVTSQPTCSSITILKQWLQLQ